MLSALYDLFGRYALLYWQGDFQSPLLYSTCAFFGQGAVTRQSLAQTFAWVEPALHVFADPAPFDGTSVFTLAKNLVCLGLCVPCVVTTLQFAAARGFKEVCTHSCVHAHMGFKRERNRSANQRPFVTCYACLPAGLGTQRRSDRAAERAGGGLRRPALRAATRGLWLGGGPVVRTYLHNYILKSLRCYQRSTQ